MTYWDFNSLYPTAMTKNLYYNIKSTFPFKTGILTKTNKININNIYRISSFRAG